MQASTIDTPTAAQFGTIFVAIELSQKSWLVTLHSPDRNRMSRHNLASGDHAGLLALIGRERDRVSRTTGGIPAVVSCYEAGSDGYWLHRLLLAAGITKGRSNTAGQSTSCTQRSEPGSRASRTS